MIGLALAGSGAGWLFDQTWLVVLSLAIGDEETLESSVMHFALTHRRDLRITVGAEFEIATSETPGSNEVSPFAQRAH